MTEYVDAQADFYEKNVSLEKCHSILQALSGHSSGSKCLYVGEEGIEVVGRIQRSAQTVKGWLGFENRTQVYRVGSELLRWLYYVQTQGYGQEEKIKFALENIKKQKQYHKIFQVVHKALEVLVSSADGKIEAHLRTLLWHYHIAHKQALLPPLWHRLFHFPKTVDRSELQQFGDTYLCLAKKAYQESCFKETVAYLKRAVELKIEEPVFQKKIQDIVWAYLPYIHDAKGNLQAIFLRLGEYYYKRKDYTQALLHLHEGEKLGELVLEQKQKLGVSYLKTHQWEKAFAFVSLLEKPFSHDDHVQSLLGEAYSFQKEYERALSCIQRALLLSPQNASYTKQLQNRAIEAGDFFKEHQSKALEYYEMALQAGAPLDLSKGGWGYRAAEIYLRRQKVSGRADMNKVLGEICLKRGEWKRAFLFLEWAYAQDSENSAYASLFIHACLGLGNHYAKGEDRTWGQVLFERELDNASAYRAYQRAWEMGASKAGDWWSYFIMVCQRQKKPKQAVEVYEKVRQLFPKQNLLLNGTAYYQLAQEYARQEKWKEARFCCLKAYERDPYNDDYCQELSSFSFSYARQEFDEGRDALPFYREAYSLNPSPWVAAELAVCLADNAKSLASKDLCQAITLLKEALRHDPYNQRHAAILKEYQAARLN